MSWHKQKQKISLGRQLSQIDSTPRPSLETSELTPFSFPARFFFHFFEQILSFPRVRISTPIPIHGARTVRPSVEDEGEWEPNGKAAGLASPHSASAENLRNQHPQKPRPNLIRICSSRRRSWHSRRRLPVLDPSGEPPLLPALDALFVPRSGAATVLVRGSFGGVHGCFWFRHIGLFLGFS